MMRRLRANLLQSRHRTPVIAGGDHTPGMARALRGPEPCRAWASGVESPAFAAAISLVLISPAPAGDWPTCDEDAGDCFSAHLTPGCECPECCNLVCAIESFCCEVQWDAACAGGAELLCEPCAVPPCGSEGDCFAGHDDPGCEHQECCELVCSIDDFCCDVIWDDHCAEQAMQLCGERLCDVLNEFAAPESEPCGENLNSGCNLEVPAFTPIVCGQSWFGTVSSMGGPRDVDWYQLLLSEPATIRWTVKSEFPAELSIMTGDCEGTLQVEAVAFADSCEPATAELAAEPGRYFLIVAPSTPVEATFGGISCRPQLGTPAAFFGNEYVATLESCGSGEECPSDIDGSGVVGFSDLILVIDAWGACAGCPEDLDGSGDVGFSDLLSVISDWGPCE